MNIAFSRSANFGAVIGHYVHRTACRAVPIGDIAIQWRGRAELGAIARENLNEGRAGPGTLTGIHR